MSFQPAINSSGISTAVITTNARAIPSTPRMYPVPKVEIQVRFSTNWKRSPAGSKRTASSTVTASTANDTASPAYLAV